MRVINITKIHNLPQYAREDRGSREETIYRLETFSAYFSYKIWDQHPVTIVVQQAKPDYGGEGWGTVANFST
jgi:hypothetical protein